MRIRYKILLILTLIMIILIASLYAVAQSTVNNSIRESERTGSSANVLRLTRNIDITLANINNSVNDWSNWDDTYFFVENNNTGYIESNLMDDTFVNLQLNMILYFNQDCELIFGKMYDFANRTAAPFSEAMIKDITDNPSLFSNSSVISQEGITLVSGAPMLIAAHSILDNEQNGPVHGTLIMGRYLDDIQLALLSLSTGLPVSISLLDAPQQGDFKIAQEKLTEEIPIFTQPLNETTGAGYVLLNDIEGRPVIIARILSDRAEYAQGTTTVMYVGASMFIIIIVMFLIIAALLDKLVVKRLSALSDNVTKIRQTGDNSKRVSVKGNDELSRLSENINIMLDAIDNNTRLLEQKVKDRTKDLYTNQEKLKSILLASPDAIVATDLSGNITECNDKMVDLCGLQRDLLLGKNALSFFEENIAELLQKITPDKAGPDGIVRFETVLVKKGAGRIAAEISVNILEDERCKPVGYVAIVRDVSERKALEQRLFNSERLAAIGELAGMVGHDLRNPLSAIRNAAYILKKKCSNCKNTKGVEMLEVIDKSIDHSNNIVNDLLEYSRGIHLELTECSLEELLRTSLLMVKVPGNVKIMESVTDVKLQVDESKIVRAFINLIRNSLDAMPNGGIIEVSNWQENGYEHIVFTDTGIGMSPEMLSKIFSPLFTTKAQGMGFGLSISKRAIEAHGGKIFVLSAQGKGTTCIILLPLKIEWARATKTEWVLPQDPILKKNHA